MKSIVEKLGITPGPWKFDVRPRDKNCSLKNDESYTVMDFRRWGMQSAQPYFSKDGIIHPVERFSKLIDGREHHKWINEIDHPDAKVIESAPEMLEALILIKASYSTGRAIDLKSCFKTIEKATGKTWEEIKEIINE